jgi:hypothetical protein
MRPDFTIGSRALPLAVMVFAMAACGGSTIEGTYTGGDDSLLDSLTFKSGGIVDVTIANGIGGEGAYTVDGDTVTINSNGTVHVLTRTGNGCLQGQFGVGTLCKAGGSASAASASAGDGAGTLSGAYEARTPDGSLTLEFLDDRQARLTITEGGGAEANEASYRVSGDRITVTGPTGESMSLVRKGDMLEADMGGLVVRFSKR